MSFTPASQALARFKVLDLTRVRAGPTAARQLADWGADVIKIELPAGAEGGDMGGPRHGPDFQNLHRNKRSLTLNLKEKDGLAIFKRMVESADVVVENYRPDVKFRLGVDYETIRSINKRIVYGSISGFGEDGPYRKRPGFDQIAQGMGGLMSITGIPGQGPVRVGIPIADLGAGIFCAMGILVALLEREISGEGQWVQSSLLGAQISLLDFQAARWLIAKEVPGQAGNDHPTSIPTGVFPTRDGHVNIAASGAHIFARFCQALELGHLLQDPLFADDAARSANRMALNKAIAEVTKLRTSAELIDLLNNAGVPCGPINRMDEVFADSQVKHLGMAAPIGHASLGNIALVNQAVKLSRTPNRMVQATPEKGEHTEEILREYGYDPDCIADLRDRKII
ncbi:CaiB/BaiF CoA transferase family protein [Bradyrhizobium cenepequi]|uniref:CaiB/BaiF CoA transferase family protein n=1 Tax=Bradyrhizobium cenepequi TaxID=2821403 RepID=UPI001CE330A7|nr:CoA transferase [Bradyrhizobium cenepequi]MCA6112238.1 CoA transferase [Bradyrhizobium cenepequi]